MNKFLLFTDGGSRNNPGISGAGAILTDTNGKVVAKAKKELGIRTNNQAEYEALILGLQTALDHQTKDLTVFMDSNLIVNQIQGLWKIKDTDLRLLATQAQDLAKAIPNITYQYIPREKNKLADELANQAMDAQ